MCNRPRNRTLDPCKPISFPFCRWLLSFTTEASNTHHRISGFFQDSSIPMTLVQTEPCVTLHLETMAGYSSPPTHSVRTKAATASRYIAFPIFACFGRVQSLQRYCVVRKSCTAVFAQHQHSRFKRAFPGYSRFPDIPGLSLERRHSQWFHHVNIYFTQSLRFVSIAPSFDKFPRELAPRIRYEKVSRGYKVPATFR